eukprot:3105541-Prymnesium_polylepis.1
MAPIRTGRPKSTTTIFDLPGLQGARAHATRLSRRPCGVAGAVRRGRRGRWPARAARVSCACGACACGACACGVCVRRVRVRRAACVRLRASVGTRAPERREPHVTVVVRRVDAVDELVDGARVALQLRQRGDARRLGPHGVGVDADRHARRVDKLQTVQADVVRVAPASRGGGAPVKLTRRRRPLRSRMVVTVRCVAAGARRAAVCAKPQMRVGTEAAAAWCDACLACAARGIGGGGGARTTWSAG